MTHPTHTQMRPPINWGKILAKRWRIWQRYLQR
jgi:hypothetical protein